MQAYKIKGKIDRYGHLIITEPINLNPGDVEVIILQPMIAKENSSSPKIQSQAKATKRKSPSKIKALQDWFEKTKPTPPDFDADRARWEALKEKYDL